MSLKGCSLLKLWYGVLCSLSGLSSSYFKENKNRKAIRLNYTNTLIMNKFIRATSQFTHLEKFNLNVFKFLVCNLFQSSPSLTILVPLWFIIISLVFSILVNCLITENFRDTLISRISRFEKNRKIEVTRAISVANITWCKN